MPCRTSFLSTLALLASLSSGLAQWTEPVLFGVEHGRAIRRPWISNDNLRMYAAFSGYIFVSERAHEDSAWSPFHTVGNHVNGAQRQESPCESPSGDTLYFMAEGREPTFGWYDIYYTVRTDSGWWGPILNCGPQINSEWMEWTVGISRDGSKLIVASDRIPGGTLNLYLSDKQPDGTWGPLISFGPNVNSVRDEEHGSLSPDNRRLVFFRQGPRMGDIYISELQDSTWSVGQSLPPPVTTSEREESDPCFAPDGRSIYFISDRAQQYHRQLYVTTDTTMSATGPQVRPLPLEIEPALFGHWQDQTLTLTLVGGWRGGHDPLRIYDLLGRRVKAPTVDWVAGEGVLRGEVALPDLPSGTYVADLQSGPKRLSTRFTVTR